MSVRFGYNLNDNLYITLSDETTSFVLTFASDKFIIYDNFKVNVEETIEKSGDENDDGYSRDELSGDLFKQPDYSFVVISDEMQISLKKNIDEMWITQRSIKNPHSEVFKVCSFDWAERIYEGINQGLENLSSIKKFKTEQIILEQDCTWIIYNCRKRYYEYSVESSHLVEKTISDNEDTFLLDLN